MDLKRINNYEITDKIGESTTSVIYKAYDSEHNRQVSIKQLKPSDSIKRDLFKIKSYIGIEGSNLSTVYCVEDYDGSIIIVSDFVNGKTLQQLFVKSEFEKENLLELLVQISGGLAVLHKQNLIHGNLKPSNIIISESGQVILLDAGLSPFEDYQNSPEFVAPYDAYHYLSPEQVKNEPINLQSDFFAVGIIAFRILFGRLPFEGQNEDELTKSILAHHPDFSELGSGVHNRINTLLLGRLLAKDRKDRFVDIAELQATLQEIKQFDKNSSKYTISASNQPNPRKYLAVSLLAVLLVILWEILSLISK